MTAGIYVLKGEIGIKSKYNKKWRHSRREKEREKETGIKIEFQSNALKFLKKLATSQINTNRDR